MAFLEIISQLSTAASGGQPVQLRQAGGAPFQAELTQALGGLPAAQQDGGQADAQSGQAILAGQGLAAAGPLQARFSVTAGSAETSSQASVTPNIAGPAQQEGQAGLSKNVANMAPLLATVSETEQAVPTLQQAAGSDKAILTLPQAKSLDQLIPALQQDAGSDQAIPALLRAAGSDQAIATLEQTGEANQAIVVLLQGSGTNGGDQAAAGPDAQLTLMQMLPTEASLDAAAEGAGEGSNGTTLLQALQAEGEAKLLPIGAVLTAAGNSRAALPTGAGQPAAQAGESTPALTQLTATATRGVPVASTNAQPGTPTAQAGLLQGVESPTGEAVRTGEAGAESGNQANARAARHTQAGIRPQMVTAAAGGADGESVQIGESVGEDAAQAAARATAGGRSGANRQIPVLFAQQPQAQTAAAASHAAAAAPDLDAAARQLAASTTGGRDGAVTNPGAGLALETAGSGQGQSGPGGQGQSQNQLPFQIQALQSLTAGQQNAASKASSTSSSFEALLGAASGETARSGGSAAGNTAGSAGTSASTPQHAGGSNTPAMQVGLSIGKAAANGQNRFTLRLDPPDLGRVEVKMEVSNDGNLRAMIRTDSRETLELLQRDARTLERALLETGLKTDSGSLNFSLSQNGQNGNAAFGQNDSDRQSVGTNPDAESASGDDAMDDAAEAPEVRFTATENGSLDITV